MILPYCNEYVPLSVPPNGLVIYCGTIVTDEGKEKKVNIDFEPFKPINTSLYLCDNKVGVIQYALMRWCKDMEL
jgi:peptide subunit release factor 1 (eRF1)